MKRLLFITLCFFTIFLNESCKKEEATEQILEDATSMDKLKVPYGFTWESAKDVNFTFTTTDSRFKNLAHVVSVYDNNGKLLSRGSITKSQNFKTKIYLADTLKEVLVVKTAPDNSQITKKATINKGSQTINFDAVSAQANKTSSSKSKAGISGEPTPDCNTGCTQTIATSQNDIDVNTNQTICVTGSNITIGLRNLNGGTIRICGSNVTVNNANLSGNVTLIVTGSANFPHLNYNSSTATVKNYGSITVNGSFAIGGIFINNGTLTPGGDFNLNSNSSSLSNNGTISATNGTTNVGTGGTVTNNGTMTLKRLQINSNGTFTNNCKLYVQTDFINNYLLNNYSYVQVSGATTVNSQGKIDLYNGAIFQTKDVQTLDGFIRGFENTSLVKVTGATSADVKQSRTRKVKGAVQYCEDTTLPAAFFDEGAVQGCDLFIASSGCNPGNGTNIVDTDGDTVPDNLDDYPTDPTKAFDNDYPSDDPTSGATVAFEDQWPKKGDYDMNDVVVSYRFKIVTNATNKVVEVNGNYTLYARGGSFQNGFGIEFPISRSMVSDVSGGRLEDGQQKAVIIIFTNMKNEMATYNTEPTKSLSAPKAYSLTFKVNNGPSLEAFGLGSYNPFIWNNGEGKTRGEVHLPGKTPTSLADLTLFGTGADDSDPSKGRYYVTKDGLPWAINIPVKKFDYPTERNDIVSSYLKLQSWAQSGGTQYPDWYLDLPGYRNSATIFSK